MSQKPNRPKNLPHPMRISSDVISRRSLLHAGAGALGIFLVTLMKPPWIQNKCTQVWVKLPLKPGYARLNQATRLAQ